MRTVAVGKPPSFSTCLPRKVQAEVAAVLLVLGCISVSPLCTRALAEIERDTTSAPFSWDFSERHCGCPPCLSGCEDLSAGDFRHLIVFSPPIGEVLAATWGIQLVSEDTPIDSVKVAPEQGYADYVVMVLGHTYVLKTREGHHALLRILESTQTFLRFEYKYQDDGTGVFEEDIPVLRTTWGHIKKSEAGAAP